MLYVGVTGDIRRRVWQHKNKLVAGFTSRYNLTQLVYYETFYYPDAAIAREKEIKGWRRSKKIALIESMNPRWEDMARDWQNIYKPDAANRGEIATTRKFKLTHYLEVKVLDSLHFLVVNRPNGSGPLCVPDQIISLH